ncbi:hypothetical protein DQ04_07781000 [Trypanosoma grayi]|uniref:hypothetical protein n=1 Tax=Trypanosoma grayi TaxID=71804 RepID=UPI0004F47EF9|nr:hypothetical protein DQ04_07781000 [Trypanosoma grayi]KEG08190.1 hypothetical protein DQ04_07781000 [Trypanosoma grayi]
MIQGDAPKNLLITAFLCTTRGFLCDSKRGPSRHHVVRHEFGPDTVKLSQRRQCERKAAFAELSRVKESTLPLCCGKKLCGEAILHAKFCPVRLSIGKALSSTAFLVEIALARTAEGVLHSSF